VGTPSLSDTPRRHVPKVSVCIPTFNTARYLPEAIDSVLDQSFSDYELVVYDDASTDDTSRVMERYRSTKVVYVRFDTNLGQAGAWNHCVSLARGEYVALLHADDRYLPGFLEDRVSTLDRHRNVGLAFGPVMLIDQNGIAVGEKHVSTHSFLAPAPEFLKTLLLDCVIYPPSVVVRRCCYEIIGPFNDDHFWGIDWEFWLRLSMRYTVAYSASITAAYRVHSASATPTALSTARTARDGFEVLEQVFREINQTPQLAAYAAYRRPAFHAFALRTLSHAGFMCERRFLPAARMHLRYALKADPTLLSRPTVWALCLSSYFGPWLYRTFRALRGT
jgi:glycosyltransferase involved in cell wall biosynthesis